MLGAILVAASCAVNFAPPGALAMNPSPFDVTENAVFLTDSAVYVGQLPPTSNFRYEPPSVMQVAWSGEATQPGGAPPPLPSPEEVRLCDRVSEYKDGFFQKFAVSETWLVESGRDSYELHELDASLTVALPAPTVSWPLLITTGFGTRLLEGPRHVDLPPRLYETYLQFLWVPRLSEQLSFVYVVTPGLYADFNSLDNDAYRTTGRALVRYEQTPGVLQWIAGVVYLGREDFPLLPVGGAIWDPSPPVHLELIFPQPKAAWRAYGDPYREFWLYAAAEFGGNTWSVETAPGHHEKLTLGDIRLLAGWELRRDGGGGLKGEIGYVFERSVEITGQGESGVPDTFLVRFGTAL